jgi:hypothetical protein
MTLSDWPALSAHIAADMARDPNRKHIRQIAQIRLVGVISFGRSRGRTALNDRIGRGLHYDRAAA